MRILQLWPTEIKVKTDVLVGLRLIALTGILLLGGYCSAQAQGVCNNPVAKGGFTLSKTTVCVGTPVTIASVASNISNDQYNFAYDGVSPIDKIAFKPAKNFTYTQSGTYTVIQIGSGGGQATGTIACQVVMVVPNDPIKFTAQSCLGRRATVTVDASTIGQYDTYIIQWGDGVAEEKSRTDMLSNPTHTYNLGYTNVTIKVQGIVGTPTNRTCESIVTSYPITLLAAATQPVISALTTTSDKAIDLSYQTGAGVSVQLYQKINGVYTGTGQSGTGLGTFTVQTDAKQVQCFQLIAQDACNSAPIKSDEVCSLVLDVKAANKQNDLSWQPYAGTIAGATQFRYYRISRNGKLAGATRPDRNTSSYSDAADIICGTQYCYSIEATIAGSTGQTIVTSAQTCVNGINGDVPGNVGSVIVSIENNHPQLSTIPPATISSTDSYTMIVSRRPSGSSGSFQPVAALDRKSTFTDNEANASAGSYCYQVTYQSSCGMLSAPSTPVCTVFLTSNSPTGIDWNADSPFAPDAVDNYLVEIADSIKGSNGQQYPVGSNTHYEPDPNDPNLQQQRYRIIVRSSTGDVSYSNFFRFAREVKIFVPDAFTPNGDDMNSKFIAKGLYIAQFSMNIYNRWGEVVYNTTDKTDGWDGNSGGQAAPAGQYLYRIEIIDLTGLKTVRTGALLLLR